MKKVMIIVCDDKRRKYADHLAQLISSHDDEGETTVGVKDGTVSCQVWSEKEYLGSSKSISSDQHILFIGNSSMMKEKRSFVSPAFNEHGMTYGWLGTQAFLSVEKVVSFDKYNEFIEFAKKYEENLKTIVKGNQSKKNAIDGVTVGGSAIGFLFAPIIFVPLFTVGMAVPFYKRAKMKKEIKDQMYNCAIIKFYLEDLNKYLGLE